MSRPRHTPKTADVVRTAYRLTLSGQQILGKN